MKIVKKCPKCGMEHPVDTMLCSGCRQSLVQVEPCTSGIPLSGDLLPGEAEKSARPHAPEQTEQPQPPEEPEEPEEIRGNGDLLPGEAEKTFREGDTGNGSWDKIILCEPGSREQLPVHSNGAVGRGFAPFAAMQAKYDTISRHHCDLQLRSGILYIRDNGSTNGTKVNGIRISPGVWMPLQHGDTLELANHLFTVN